MPSACYVYAIVRRTAKPPPQLRGLNGEPLSMVPWQALSAVVSTSAASGVSPTAQTLLQHEMVVETMCEMAPVLPVRFGTILPDTTAVIQALAERYETLLSDLSLVGDKVELGLTVLWDSQLIADHLDDDGSVARESVAREVEQTETQRRGTRYLLARREAYRRDRTLRTMAQAVAEALDRHLQPYVRASRFTVDTAPGLAIRAAFLVDRGAAIAQAQAALDGCRAQYPALRFLITGPWPPYSFVSPPSPQTEAAAGPLRQKAARSIEQGPHEGSTPSRQPSRKPSRRVPNERARHG